MQSVKQLLWTAEDIAAVTGGRLIGEDFSVTGISIDTRQIEQGDLFIALKGPNFDGNAFAQNALENGAAGVLVEKGEAAKHILVKDTFRALQDLGAGGRARSEAKIFAITGSVGKTSAKDMLAHMLRYLGKTHAAEASLNNHWGVPLSLARLPQDAAFAVLEIGMNHAGEISALSKLAAPHVAIITTIASAHIQHLGSIENIAMAKAEIFHGMDADGIAVLPRDSEQYPILLAEARTQGLQKIITFGEHEESDIRLIDLYQDADHSVVTASVQGTKINFTLTVPGKHQALNALAVIGAVWAAGEDVEKALPALAALQPVKGRGNRFLVTLEQDKPPILVIDETHNASPVAVEAALKLLGHIPTQGRRLIVLGDMLELGDRSAEFHADLKKPIIDTSADLILTSGPMMAHLAKILPSDLSKHYADSTILAAEISKWLQPGDVVLVKGSRGSKMIRVIDALKELGQFEEPIASQQKSAVKAT